MPRKQTTTKRRVVKKPTVAIDKCILHTYEVHIKCYLCSAPISYRCSSCGKTYTKFHITTFGPTMPICANEKYNPFDFNI